MATSVYLDRLRQHNIEAYQKRGLALVVRKAWTPEDLESGAAEPCPICWEPAYKQSSNKNCATCVGSGVVGVNNGAGYQDPIFTWGNVVFQSGHGIESREGAGDWATKEAGGSTCCHTPLIDENDLIFVVDSFAGEIATSVSGLVQVDDVVIRYTMRGALFGIQSNTFNLEEQLLYQAFNVQWLPDNDIRQTLAFVRGD